MKKLDVLILFIIGLFAGFAGGLLGIGGGVFIILPLLAIFKVSQKEAQGISIAVLLPPTGILGAVEYYRAGEINIWYAVVIAISFVIGGYFGSRLALKLPVKTLRLLFGIFLIVISINLFFK
ncbi:MAG: TSUP family transporter [Hyphomicrobiales bacterium]